MLLRCTIFYIFLENLDGVLFGDFKGEHIGELFKFLNLYIFYDLGISKIGLNLSYYLVYNYYSYYFYYWLISFYIIGYS